MKGLATKVFSPVGRFFGRRSKAQLGVMFLALIALASLGLFNKSRLLVNLKDGEHISADFASNYKLRQYVSGVKMAGLKIGTVTHVAETKHGTVHVDMRVEPGTRHKLGSAPTAHVRPATILGGSGLSAYVDLRPGGDQGTFNGHIPTEHTGVPVELDRVLEVFNDGARQGFSSSIGAFDSGLANGGGAALGHVAEQAPGALPAATAVVGGLQGQHPGDLSALVDRVGRTAAALTATDGEIESVLSGAATASGTLGRRAADFRSLLGDLPTDLTTARTGLDALSGSLGRLEATAPGARASVQRLGALLDAAGPVLADARPLLANARPLLAQLDPLFSHLTPTAAAGTKVLDDLGAPAINRINNPILSTFTAPYRQSATRMYQEFGYFLAGLDGVLKYTDRDGAAIDYHGGINEATVSEGRPFDPAPGGQR